MSQHYRTASFSLTRIVGRTALAAVVSLAAWAASLGVALASGDAAPPAAGGSPLGSYLAARHAQKERDLGAAADLMSIALAADPKNAELLQSTYALMASAGRMSEAAALARRLEQLGAGSPTATLSLVLADVKAGRTRAAADRLAKLPSDSLTDVVKPMVGAWLKLDGEGADAAVAALAPLATVQGIGALQLMHVGLINAVAGRVAAADVAFKKAVADSPQLSLRLVQIVGNFYQVHGRVEDARALYKKYLDADPSNSLVDPMLASLSRPKPAATVASTREGIAESLFDIASVLYQEKASDMAVLFTRMAIDMRPRFPISQLLLADILAEQGRPADAIAIYRQVVDDPLLGWQAELSVAAGLDDVGNTDEAVATLRKMTAEHTDSIDAAVRLGNVLRAHERFAEAAEAYDVALSRIKVIQPQHWTLLYYRGIARERSKQWPPAEADFLKALELQPEQPYVMNYLAYSWVEKGEHYDKALEMLKRAVDLKPEDGFIVDSLGWVFYRLGRFADAVNQLEQAIELKPGDPVINDHLGDAYWQVGRRNEARFQWRRALYYKPDADQVGQIEEKIERGLTKNSSGS